MSGLRSILSGWRWVEAVMATAIVASLVWCVGYLFVDHILPQPFFYEPSDVYADWFNTAFWARFKGTYDTWKTVYPPLTFVFLRLVGLDRCYTVRGIYDVSAGLAARDCDWVGIVMIWLIFAVNVVLIWRILSKLDSKTALPRTICVGLGLPMLNGVERGNLFLIAFTCLLLAAGPILRSARLRWLFAGLAVNFKVYLVAAFVPLLLKRRWRWVECALISVIIVYMLSYALLGRGAPMEVINNIREFSNQPVGAIQDAWSETTYLPLINLLKGDYFPSIAVIGSRNLDLLLFALPALQHLTQALIVAAAASAWLRPERIPAYRLINLGLMLALITSESGSYTPAYFMLFVMMEPWRGLGRRWAIFGCYLIALPLEYRLYPLPPIVHDTYMGGETVITSYYVGLSPFVRPFIIMTIAMALSLTTIREVWLDVRLQGWAGRWRLRRDAPLLPGVRRPAPRAAAVAIEGE